VGGESMFFVTIVLPSNRFYHMCSKLLRVCQLSISSTFYEQSFVLIFFCQKLQSHIVIREKLWKTLSFKKRCAYIAKILPPNSKKKDKQLLRVSFITCTKIYSALYVLYTFRFLSFFCLFVCLFVSEAFFLLRPPST